MNKDEFKFDEAEHAYTLNGKFLPSVTTILKVISKGDAITQWSANLTAKTFSSEIESFLNAGRPLDHGFLSSVNDKARYAWKDNMSTAGSFGTNVHKAIENYVKQGPLYEPVGLIDTELTAFNNFRNWWEGEDARMILSEEKVYSKELWYAGTIDLVLETKEGIWIGDVKTSASIYPEYFFQTAAYERALRERGFDKKIVGHVIINVRKDGKVDVKRSYGYTDNLAAFLGAYTVYKRKQALEAELGIKKFIKR